MPIDNRLFAQDICEKLLNMGAKNLSNAELLAIFMRSGIKGKKAINFARMLLCYFGSLRSLFNAREDQICGFPGFNKAKYIQLQAILEISNRYLEEQLTHESIICNAKTASLYLTARLRNYKHEVFACLLLDNQNHVIHYEELFHGSIDNATIYPREVVKTILYHNASAVIFAHNHTSGELTPSQQDTQLTYALAKILYKIEVRVLDHIIIGSNGWVAMSNYELSDKLFSLL